MTVSEYLTAVAEVWRRFDERQVRAVREANVAWQEARLSCNEEDHTRRFEEILRRRDRRINEAKEERDFELQLLKLQFDIENSARDFVAEAFVVPATPTPDERTTYRTLMARVHPDKHVGKSTYEAALRLAQRLNAAKGNSCFPTEAAAVQAEADRLGF